MLLFSYKLENYIKYRLFKQILLVPNKFIIKGSFRRKIPFVCDVDCVNNVYPTYNENNIYQAIVELIHKIKNNDRIILVYVTCGLDERFRIIDGSDEDLNRIRSLLKESDIKDFDLALNTYPNDFDKKLFYVTEIIWKYSQLRWTPQNVLDNEMHLPGNVIVKLTDVIKENTTLLLQYYVKIESYPIGIDCVTNYKTVNLKKVYTIAAEYQLKLANYSKEYYYMLFPFKHYFRDNKQILEELEYLIEQKFGLYKQLMVRIDTYLTLFKTANLDIKTATHLVIGIINDCQKLPGFTSNTINKISEIAIDNPPDVKMSNWYILLQVLYDEINAAVNFVAKPYFYKYLNLIPEDLQNRYCIIQDLMKEQSRIVRYRLK